MLIMNYFVVFSIYSIFNLLGRSFNNIAVFDIRMSRLKQQRSLLYQIDCRQITGAWIPNESQNESSEDIIRSYQPFMAGWLKQYTTLDRQTTPKALVNCAKYSAPKEIIESICSFIRLNRTWIGAGRDESRSLLEKLSKLRDALSMFRSRRGVAHPPDIHVEQEMVAVFMFYFNIPAVVSNMILAVAEAIEASQYVKGDGNFENLTSTPLKLAKHPNLLPQYRKVICLAVDLLRRSFSAGEVKNDGTRRDEEHSKRFVIGELIHRMISGDVRVLQALLTIFLKSVDDKTAQLMRHQVTRLAEDCLVFAPPSTVEITKLFPAGIDFREVVSSLPDSDLPLLCRLILPAICEFDAFGPPPHSLAKLHDFRVTHSERLAVFDVNISYILSLAGVEIPPQSAIRVDEKPEPIGSSYNINDTSNNFISTCDKSNLLGRLLILAVSPIVDNLGIPILPRPLTDNSPILRPKSEPGDYWTRYITARMIITSKQTTGATSNNRMDHDLIDNDFDGVDDGEFSTYVHGGLAQDTVLAIRSRMTIFQFLSHALASKCRSSLQRYIASTGIMPKLAPLIFSLRLGASIPETAHAIFSTPHPPFERIVIPPSHISHRRFGGPLSPDHVPDMLLSVVVLRFLHALCDHSPHRRQLLGSLDFVQIHKFDPTDSEAQQVVQNPSLVSLVDRHGVLTYICFSVVYHRAPADLWYWLIRVIEAYLRSASPGDQMLVAYSGVLQRIMELILTPNGGNGADPTMRHQPSNLEVFQCSFDLLAEIVKFNVRLTNDADSLMAAPGQRHFVLRLVSENLVDANMFLRSLILTHAGHFHPNWFAGSFPSLSPAADAAPGELLRWIGSFDIRVKYIFALVTCFSSGVSSVTQDNISCLNTAILCLLLAHRASTENEGENSHPHSEYCRHESLPAYLAALVAYRPSVSLPAPAAYRSENVQAAASWLASSSSNPFSTETASRRRLLMAAANDEAEYIVGTTWLRLFRDLLRFWRTHYLAKDKDSSSLARSTRIPFEKWHSLVSMLLDDSQPAPATSIARFLNTPFRAE